MTKIELAQAIVTELLGLPHLAPKYSRMVRVKARLTSKKTLEDQYQMALKASASVGRNIITGGDK